MITFGAKDRIGLKLGILILAVGMTEVSGAAAAGSPKERRASLEIPAGGIAATELLSCGARTEVGTGFDVGDYDLSGVGARMGVIRASESVLAYNSGAGPGTIVGSVYCAKGVKRFNSPDKQGDLGPGSTVGVTAKCDPGKELTHGTFSARPTGDASFTPEYSRLNVTDSYRVGKRKWRVKAENTSPTQAFKVEVQGNCVSKGTKLQVRSMSRRIAGGDVTSVIARCRRRERVYAGGFHVSTGVRVLSSKRRGGRGWEVRAVNGETFGGTINAGAQCVRR